MGTNALYSDVNPEVNTSSLYELVIDENAINASILTILGTRKQTRVFRREFGSYLLDMLFEPMDNLTVNRIKTEITTAIGEWEPRVVMRETIVEPDYEKQQYYVEMSYVIPSLNNKEVSLVFNLNAQSH